MFLEKIGVLDYGAFERLEKHIAFLQLLGNNVALDQLIVRENHPRGDFIQTAGIFQNVAAIVIREHARNFERRKIEKIDIGKAPELIFAVWRWQRLELPPSFGLLVAKPLRQFPRLDRTGENRAGLHQLILNDE